MPNYEVFSAINKPLDKHLHMYLFSCSKKLVYKTTNRFFVNKLPFKVDNTQNSKLAFVQTTSFESLQHNEITYPLNTYFDNLTYHPENTIQDNKNPCNYLILTKTIFLHNLNISSLIYKLLVLTTLKNLKSLV